MKIINTDNCDSSKIFLDDQYLYDQVARSVSGYKDLLLAYSGGLDSTVLLDILTKLIKGSNSLIKLTIPIFLKAVYVHHGISSQSNKWAEHCQEQCNIRNIPFDIIYINCPNFFKNRRNIESISRRLRYEGLCNYLNPHAVLLTAHHIDDQLETVLLSLKRGSGPAGLSGINKNIVLDNRYQLLRPLLECTRMQLQTYAIRKKLIWIEDDTNIDTRFDRNFLRIKIIPILKRRWPALNRIVARTARLCKDQENLLHELLLESLHELIDTDGSLFFSPLFQYSVLKRQFILRLWLKKFLINMPSYQLLNRIWEEVALSRVDANPILYIGQYICRRFRKKLYILPIDIGSSVNISMLSWDLSNNIVRLPYNLGLLVSQMLTINNSCFKKQTGLSDNSNFLLNIFLKYFKNSGKILTNCLVRRPESYEKISVRFGYVHGLLHILNRNRGRKLKKILQELDIPPWTRSRIPLLFYNNILITAIGVFITKEGEIKNTTQIINNDYIVWRIFWLQDSVYYNFFKNAIRRFLNGNIDFR